MSDEISALEKFAISLSVIPVSMFVVMGLTYGICVGESLIKSIYQKKNGDSKSFRELYHENFAPPK